MIEFITTGNFQPLQQQIIIVLLFWAVMVIAVAIDLWSGIDKARALHQQLYSRSLRRTIIKMGEYWRVQLMFLLFDIMGGLTNLYALPYASMLGTVSVVTIELKSVFENLKLKRSGAAQIPDVLEQIINCQDKESAKRVIKIFKESKDEDTTSRH